MFCMWFPDLNESKRENKTESNKLTEEQGEARCNIALINSKSFYFYSKTAMNFVHLTPSFDPLDSETAGH